MMKNLSAFEVHKGETGGYVIREPWANGKLWVVTTVDDLHKWIDEHFSI
jgi:hypothetical protein